MNAAHAHAHAHNYLLVTCKDVPDLSICHAETLACDSLCQFLNHKFNDTVADVSILCPQDTPYSILSTNVAHAALHDGIFLSRLSPL